MREQSVLRIMSCLAAYFRYMASRLKMLIPVWQDHLRKSSSLELYELASE